MGLFNASCHDSVLTKSETDDPAAASPVKSANHLQEAFNLNSVKNGARGCQRASSVLNDEWGLIQASSWHSLGKKPSLLWLSLTPGTLLYSIVLLTSVVEEVLRYLTEVKVAINTC